jgi:hypothetical protein
MRLVLSLLRVTVLGALVVILLAKPGSSNAQSCLSFTLIEDSCASCCSLHNTVDSILVANGPGLLKIGSANLACGSTPASCDGVACGDHDEQVPAVDPTCVTCP